MRCLFGVVVRAYVLCMVSVYGAWVVCSRVCIVCVGGSVGFDVVYNH